MNQVQLLEGIQFLAEQGLNLFAILDCATLPDETVQALVSEDIPVHDYTRLVLVGHGGRRLWQALAAFGMKTADPVDHFSLTMIRQFIDDYLGAPPVLILYPSGYTIPLQKLGILAGWHHPSPLGLGINQTYGLWFAYRSVFLTTMSLPPTQHQLTTSPCDTCRDKPCVSACPAQAVQDVGQFRVMNCVDYRLQTQSSCRDRCLSRLACPVAPEHRYDLEQLNYHYNHSLVSLQQYFREK
jgi:hypothetical protein